MTEPESVPLNRWGRIAEPADSEGAFLLVEQEKPDEWKVAPPDDAQRIWRRRPGAADDDDTENWTVWLHEADVAGWLTAGGYKIAEWLPEGTEPLWHHLCAVGQREQPGLDRQVPGHQA